MTVFEDALNKFYTFIKEEEGGQKESQVHTLHLYHYIQMEVKTKFKPTRKAFLGFHLF